MGEILAGSPARLHVGSYAIKENMKSSTTNLKPTLDFLAKLNKNNNRDWFNAHRADYERAREAFEIFVDALIREHGKIEDLKGVAAKDCIFRIYRDVRFSKDKSPYKTHMAAAITPGGKQSGKLGYYLHVGPDNQSFIAGGLHMPDSKQLGKFRQAIARDASKFKKVLAHKDFVKYLGTVGGDKLKTAPAGFARDHPDIEWLKLKQVLAGHQVPDKQVLAPSYVAYTVQVFKALKPFLDYLNSVLEG